MESCEKSRFVRDSEEYCFGHVWLKNQVQYPSVVLIKWTIGCANENVEFIIFFLASTGLVLKNPEMDIGTDRIPGESF